MFGFHLARLDIREHASRHRQAIAGLFAYASVEPDYGGLDEDARCSLLTRALAEKSRLLSADRAELPPVAGDVLDTFAMLRDALSSGYRDALGAYVVSASAAPSDVLEVLLLMKETGLAAVGGAGAALPIAPLFEDGESLRDAATTMGALLRTPGLPRRAQLLGQPAGGDDRLLGLQQGRRLPRLDVGRARCSERTRRAAAARVACALHSFTAVAGRSAAVAGQRTSRSSPSRRARSRDASS